MKELEDCLNVAKTISANSEDRGMASVMVIFSPYEAKWFAEANWSDNLRIQSNHYKLEVAMLQLKESLQNFAKKLRPDLDIDDK